MSCERASVAQSVEQLICNQWVVSSILAAGSRGFGFLLEGYRSGQTGRTVNPLADAYGGSNPSPSNWQPSGVLDTLSLGLNARVAQAVEHPLGKGEVVGSTPTAGSKALAAGGCILPKTRSLEVAGS